MLLALALAHAMAQSDDAVVAWLRTSALPLKTVQAGNGFDDLDPFGKSLDGVRIVGMGEPTHGTREAFLFKHRMLEYLVERKGYRVFGIEASFPDCLPIETYVQTGEGDPETVVHGQGFWTWDTEEVLDLVQWMRTYNKSHTDHVHFVGFDMQAKAPAYARALAYWKRWGRGSGTELPASNPSVQDAAAAMSLLDKNRAELVRESGADAFDIARQCAYVALQASANEGSSAAEVMQALTKAQSKVQDDIKALHKAGWESKSLDEVLKMVDEDATSRAEVLKAKARIQGEHGAVPRGAETLFTDFLKDLDELAKQFARLEEQVGWRDRCMADNVAWTVNKLYPRSKAMLWAHNYHIGASVPEDNPVETMGRHLTAKFGRAYFPVGFSFGLGSFQSRLMSSSGPMGALQAFEVGPPLMNSLDETLGKAGSLFLAVFDNAPKNVRRWLDEPHPTRTCGAAYDPTTPNTSYRNDRAGKWFRAMVYIGKTTRARPLRLTRERFGIKKDW